VFGSINGKQKLLPRLTQPVVLEDGRPPRVLSATLYTISGFVLAAIFWAAITDVREVTIAPGQVIPSDQVHTVNHLEGGIVAELLVREGMRVEQGQPIIRLEPTATASDLDQLEVRGANLTLQIIRLDAQSRDIVPNLGPLATAFPKIAAEQLKLYASAMETRRQERITLIARIAQRRSEVATLLAELQTAKAQVEVTLEQFDIQSKLITQGLASRKIFLDAKAAVNRTQGDVTATENKLATAREALSEAESALAQADATAAQKIAEERTKATSDLAETERQVAKFSDRFERLLVRAPSPGLVQELAPKAAGEVLKPGDVVARIVPSGFELVAEVRIDPKDSGHIKAGAHAEIKFATFDSAIFGTVPGKIERISATTFSPQFGVPPLPGHAAGEPYYKAIIRLENSYVGSGPAKRPITPGMVVQAEIVTGRKSIVRYLLKPVYNSLDVAFTER
jgi:HlyD family secretion protein/adhesin transport system membrane fusion protein